MSVLRTVTLHNAAGATLITLQARDNDASVDTPTRNYDPVQPPGSTIQGVFGTGLHQVGVLERDFAICNMTGFASAYHAKAALERALMSATSVRTSGWELPLAAPIGVTEWQHLLVGLRARLRLVPSSAYWRDPTGTKAGMGVQNGQNVSRMSGATFASTDVGRLLVWEYDSGATFAEAYITAFTSSEAVVVDLNQDVGFVESGRASVAFTVYDAVTGIL